MNLKERIEEIINTMLSRIFDNRKLAYKDVDLEEEANEKVKDQAEQQILELLLGEEVFCVITVQEKWEKPEGCGFIYRNILGVYNSIEKATKLQERFMNFIASWEKTKNEYEWRRKNGNCLLGIIKLNPNQDAQIFDWNH
ncbi:MAG: hypothetical protein KKB31_06375 [Nanoarchaeota archaeon]|nr:hypothetical protein [Nanoarchaeota archaeon]